MGDWQEPETVDGKMMQRRSCNRCNLIEFRVVLVSIPKDVEP